MQCWVRRVCIAMIALALAARTAGAEPAWVEDLRAKAAAYEQRLRDALGRLDAAAAAAADRLAADARKRLAELRAILAANLRAAQRMLADHAHGYEVVVHARLREASEVADQLARELDEVIAGTRRQLGVDARRLVTGARGLLDESLREAGRQVASVEVIDGALVARAARRAGDSAMRWLGLVAAGGGLVVLALGVGLVWPRRSRGEHAARRWIVTALGAAAIAAGAVTGVLGIRHWRDDAAPVLAGLARCDALADAQRLIDAGRADRATPAHAAALAALERCQLLVADTSTAELVADRLDKLRSLPH